jgi:hypothetical protein
MFSWMISITGVVQAFRAWFSRAPVKTPKPFPNWNACLRLGLQLITLLLAPRRASRLNVPMICFDFSSLGHWNVQC